MESQQIAHIYREIRSRAREIIVRYKIPDFYTDFAAAIQQSQQSLTVHPILIQLKEFVAEIMNDNYGHGLDHALKVSVDAGALTLIEGKLEGLSDSVVQKTLLLAQCAGLLHDVKRTNKDHAQLGAVFANELLSTYPFDQAEIDNVCNAINNHEAFKSVVPIESVEGQLISDCLYDADKFRWGPDNFATTVWEMLTFKNIALSKFIEYFPKGMEGPAKIKHTFRTATGKRYGPQFIDLGLAIGVEIYEILKKEYSDHP